MNADQALREAAAIRQPFDIVPELQANYAFTKAYLAENSGSKGGLAGSNCFVDMAIFDDPMPSWVVTKEIVKWTNENPSMTASFAQIVDLVDCSYEGGRPSGIRDGVEIAQHLTHDTNVLNSLRVASNGRS